MNLPARRRGYTTELRRDFKSKDDFISYIIDSGRFGKINKDFRTKYLSYYTDTNTYAFVVLEDCASAIHEVRSLKEKHGKNWRQGNQYHQYVLKAYAYAAQPGTFELSLVYPRYEKKSRQCRPTVTMDRESSWAEYEYDEVVGLSYKPITIAGEKVYLAGNSFVSEKVVMEITDQDLQSSRRRGCMDPMNGIFRGRIDAKQGWLNKAFYCKVFAAFMMLWFLHHVAERRFRYIEPNLAIISIISFIVSEGCKAKGKSIDIYAPVERF